MKNRTLIVFFLLMLLALLGYKLIFVGEKPSVANFPNTMGNSPPKLQPSEPISKVKSPFKQPNAPGAKISNKMKSELVAGGRSWKLDFADDSLRAEVRERIGFDLSLVFGHLPNFEVDTLPFPIEVDGKQLDRRVRFEGKGRKWNNVLQSELFRCLFIGTKVEELYVPKPVIEAYKKAILIEKANQAAYQQLDQFLARMSELREKPIENVRDLFLVADNFKSAEPDLAAMHAPGFAEGWGGKLYREPSILDVTETTGTPLEKYGSLVATTYAMSEGKVDDLPPLIFSNGQWRFLLQRPPT